MHLILCRVKEQKEKEQKEWLVEVPVYIGNYTLFCCRNEISFRLDEEMQAKKCVKCGKKFEIKKEGYVACVK